MRRLYFEVYSFGTLEPWADSSIHVLHNWAVASRICSNKFRNNLRTTGLVFLLACRCFFTSTFLPLASCFSSGFFCTLPLCPASIYKVRPLLSCGITVGLQRGCGRLSKMEPHDYR